MAKLNFDATTVEPASNYDIIPPGKYEVIITDTEMKPTKAGTGSYLQITFEIVGPTHMTRKLWARLNLDNPNMTAVEIAQRELSAICHAVDLPLIEDSEQLHDRMLVVDVGIEQNRQTGGESNRIKGYLLSAQAAAAAPARSAAPAAPRSAPNTPWAKRG